jgi:hypothetical protein
MWLGAKRAHAYCNRAQLTFAPAVEARERYWLRQGDASCSDRDDDTAHPGRAERLNTPATCPNQAGLRVVPGAEGEAKRLFKILMSIFYAATQLSK